MAQTAPLQHSPPSLPKRPKGILKNSASYQHTSPDASLSPAREPPHHPILNHHDGQVDGSQRPEMPPRELSEKEITQLNTEANAGGHRRNSSAAAARAALPRRQSSQNGSGSDTAAAAQHDSEMRLKWDEANLYLNEGQMGGKMKIDEPKTPYAKNYDPAEDEEELTNINAEELAVDELDMKPRPRKTSASRSKETDIPGLDIGEPEMDPRIASRESDGERRVHVDNDEMEHDGGGGHGEQREENMTRAEREKHQKFEEMRKKHYEMKNIKGLLGHSEQLDELEEDDK